MLDYSSLPAIFLCLHPPPHPGRLSSLMLQTSSNTMLARSSLFLKKRPFQQGTILKCNRTHHCCSISPNSITERLSFNAHPLMALPIAILLASLLPAKTLPPLSQLFCLVRGISKLCLSNLLIRERFKFLTINLIT